jgi:uncharacterized protein
LAFTSKNLRTLVGAICLLTQMTQPVAAADDKTVITLGTATPGGGFVVYGDAVTKTIEEFDTGLSVEPRNTKGSAENIALLEAGKLDIGLVQGESYYEALNGIGRARVNLKIIAAMYPTAGMFVVRAGSTYRTIGDLKGRPVVFGARGSGFVILARYVLDGIGLDQERDFHAVYLDRAGDGPAMLRDGRVEALWGGGIGWPGFVEVMRGPGGGRFIVPTQEAIQRIRGRHPFLQRLTIPAGSYPGQVEALESVGSWSFILARPALSDDFAYRLTRALHLGEAVLARSLPQARETTVANTVAAAPSPELLHPGTRRYLAEIGAMK